MPKISLKLAAPGIKLAKPVQKERDVILKKSYDFSGIRP